MRRSGIQDLITKCKKAVDMARINRRIDEVCTITSPKCAACGNPKPHFAAALGRLGGTETTAAPRELQSPLEPARHLKQQVPGSCASGCPGPAPPGHPSLITLPGASASATAPALPVEHSAPDWEPARAWRARKGCGGRGVGRARWAGGVWGPGGVRAGGVWVAARRAWRANGQRSWWRLRGSPRGCCPGGSPGRACRCSAGTVRRSVPDRPAR
jgi:hypothetical protein